MEEKSTYLFVYGTLLDERNPYGAYLKEHCSFYQKGKFRGKLYDLGEYPGAIADPKSDSYIVGSIFLMNDAAAILKNLDNYEGFGVDYPQPNEFVRAFIAVETEEQPIDCWVYLYNSPTKGFLQIASGDYMEYIGYRE